jgi:hypothetical protein
MLKNLRQNTIPTLFAHNRIYRALLKIISVAPCIMNFLKCMSNGYHRAKTTGN